MGDIAISIITAIFLSFLVSSIEITKEARVPPLQIYNSSTFQYFLIAAIGNVFTTLLTMSSHALNGVPGYLFPYACAIIGVSCFEVILKNTNILVAKKNILPINDWVVKARTAATNHTVVLNIQLKEKETHSLVCRLRNFPEIDLNTHVTVLFGTGMVQTLDSEAAKNNADRMLRKALAIAIDKYPEGIGISPK